MDAAHKREKYRAATAGHNVRVEIVANLRAHIDRHEPYERLTADAAAVRAATPVGYGIPFESVEETYRTVEVPGDGPSTG